MRYINLYRDRLENRGGILQRDRNLKILHREINTLAQGNPAYKKIIIDGVERYAVINRQDDYQIKEIVSMPGDFVPLGTYVTFADKVWLVEKTDYDTEVYSKSMRMLRSILSALSRQRRLESQTFISKLKSSATRLRTGL